MAKYSLDTVYECYRLITSLLIGGPETLKRDNVKLREILGYEFAGKCYELPTNVCRPALINYPRHHQFHVLFRDFPSVLELIGIVKLRKTDEQKRRSRMLLYQRRFGQYLSTL